MCQIPSKPHTQAHSDWHTHTQTRHTHIQRQAHKHSQTEHINIYRQTDRHTERIAHRQKDVQMGTHNSLPKLRLLFWDAKREGCTWAQSALLLCSQSLRHTKQNLYRQTSLSPKQSSMLYPQLFTANSGTESFITRSKCSHPSSLRPLLITKNTDKIYRVLRWQDKNTISSQEVNIGQHFAKYERKNKINWCRLAARNEFYLLHHQGQKLLCKQWRTGRVWALELGLGSQRHTLACSPAQREAPKRARGIDIRQGATAPEFSLIVEWGFYTKSSKQSLWLYTST